MGDSLGRQVFTSAVKKYGQASRRGVDPIELRSQRWMPSWWSIVALAATLIVISVAVGFARMPTTDEAAHPTSSPHQPADDAPASMKVHVIGAVKHPGLVSLHEGARVDDAITAAGGLTDAADVEQLNLARFVTDGEQIAVPTRGDTSQAGPIGISDDGKVNINEADATQLQTLTGIGPALSERIIDYRDANGPFTSVDDLTQVSGIGPAILANIKSDITV